MRYYLNSGQHGRGDAGDQYRKSISRKSSKASTKTARSDSMGDVLNQKKNLKVMKEESKKKVIKANSRNTFKHTSANRRN